MPSFPDVGSAEKSVCQAFVSARIKEINDCGGYVHPKKIASSTYKKSTKFVEFLSRPVDGHASVSFSTRRPDIPCYHAGRSGGCSITVLGDVKGCGPRHKDFPEEEIGEILDMGKDLLNKEQFTRTTLICFLTDGYRFQFFRCTRRERGSNFFFEQSDVYGEENGWKVL
jgi:hypothetical protein